MGNNQSNKKKTMFLLFFFFSRYNENFIQLQRKVDEEVVVETAKENGPV